MTDTTLSKRILAPIKPANQARRRWLALPILVAGLVLLPILVLLSEMLHPAWEMWQVLWDSILPRLILNTVVLIGGVGGATLLLGAGLAWLVTAYRFPLRGFLSRRCCCPWRYPPS